MGVQIRYVKLEDKKLIYYQNETMEKALGFLDFDLASYIYEEVFIIFKFNFYLSKIGSKK